MSFRLLRFISAVTVVIAAMRTSAHADVVMTSSQQYFGHVRSLTSQTVTIEIGCDAKKATNIAWSNVSAVLFDAGSTGCRARKIKPPNSGALGPCPASRVPGVRYRTRSGADVLAEKASVDDKRRVHLALFDGSVTHGSVTDGDSLTPSEVCVPQLPKSADTLDGFCLEPAQYAVNFSPHPVWGNGIFTYGIAVYLEVVGADTTRAPPAEWLDAFRNALASWATILFRHRKTLAPELQSYFFKTVATSAHFTMFTPPQVVEVKCKDDAQMVVRWYEEALPEAFGPKGARAAALAQVQGRTILINGSDYRYVTHDAKRFDVDRIDLAMIFAHELGHAFGLSHATGKSVMRAASDEMSSSPTSGDEPTFLDILRVAIQGTPAGEINMTECAGVIGPSLQSSAPATP